MVDIYSLEIASGFEIDRRSSGLQVTGQTPQQGREIVRPRGASAPVLEWAVLTEEEHRHRQALSLEELLNNPSFAGLPISGFGALGLDGYYLATSVSRDVIQSSPDETGKQKERVGVTTTRVGTEATHTVAVETRPHQPEPGHEFGNDLTGLVGIPANARRVRIVDETSQPTERERDPTPVETVLSENGDVALYDATLAAIDEPVFLYDLELGSQGNVDVGLFDRTDQQVFDPAHVFASGARLENGILRVEIDQATFTSDTGTMSAERWDNVAGEWTSIELTDPTTLDTEWRPSHLDVETITPTRVTAQLEFEAVAGDQEGDVYALDVMLDRGFEDPQWWIPASETSAIPADLATLLEPIASESIVDAGVEQTLVARDTVRI